MADIVFLSHTARTSDFRVGSHHLTIALARAGHTVAHISTPYSWAHRLLRSSQRSRRDAADAGMTLIDGVRDLVPSPLLPADVWWSRRQMRAVLEAVEVPHPEFVFIDQPLFPARNLGDSTLLFRPTDIFSTRHLQRAADLVAHKAHGIAATSAGVLASIDVEPGSPTTVIENGVDFWSFDSATTSDKDYDFVYVGALDARFDFDALAQAANRLRGASFAIYGPIPSSRPRLPSNVTLFGSIPYEEVPRAMARGRIGIMPFAPSRSNSGRSPMKLYEYVAAGIPVVAPADIAGRAQSLSGLVGFDATSPGAFSAALQAALGELRLGKKDRAIAQSRDWSHVAANLLTFARSVVALR